MNGSGFSDADLAGMLQARADRFPPSGMYEEIVGAVRRERAERTAARTRSRSSRGVLLVAAALVLGAGLATIVAIGSGPTRVTKPAADLGIFAPIAGRIVYGDGQFGVGTDMLGFDPAAPADPVTRVRMASEASTPVGWSSDGTELLLVRRVGPGNADGKGLYILHADGSETRVTEQPRGVRGAAISPDGSRVVFAADSALWSIDARGGSAEMLTRSQNGTIEDPTFSPDGRQIAYDDGVGDNGHSVWLIDIDGTDAHQIVPSGFFACACHVYGMAWSPTGDRIAFGLEGTTYTMATDGTDITPVITSGDYPFWSPDGSQIVYTSRCFGEPMGCGLAIANADGSRPRGWSFGVSGPWHPGRASGPSSEGEAVFDVALHVYSQAGDVGRLPDPTPIRARLPDGWAADRFGMRMGPEADHPLALSFWAIDAVFTDPCASEGRADPATVRSLDGLAFALTGWWQGDWRERVDPDGPPRNAPTASEPVEATVSGLPARSLVLHIPDDVDTSQCFRGRYATWRTAEGVRRLHRPGDVSRIWIVQVRPGSLLVIDATSSGEPSQAGLASLAEIIESMRIGDAAV